MYKKIDKLYRISKVENGSMVYIAYSAVIIIIIIIIIENKN